MSNPSGQVCDSYIMKNTLDNHRTLNMGYLLDATLWTLSVTVKSSVVEFGASVACVLKISII